MASKKSDVRFKYVNTIPSSVEQGAFYWKNENGKNQLYFSPSDKPNDIMRLDNVISGQGGSDLVAGYNISLVDIFEKPNPTIINANNLSNKPSSWKDEDWEFYIICVATYEKYGDFSDTFYQVGNVIICGNREFICTESEPIAAYFTDVDNVKYFLKKNTQNEACVDEDGNKIIYESDIIPPFDATIIGYDRLVFECFGENISKDLAEKIADFVEMEYKYPVIVSKDESENTYTLSIDFRVNNPLVVKNENGLRKVELSDGDSDNNISFNPSNTIMSVEQIQDILNQIANLNWNENL